MPNLALNDRDSLHSLVGREPSWIVHSGIGLLFSLVIILLTLTWFIRYPDVLVDSIVLTSSKPPLELVAQVDGRISDLYATNNSVIERDQLLLIVDSLIDHNNLKALEVQLDRLEAVLANSGDKLVALPRLTGNNLGELQSPFNQLVAHLKAFNLLLSEQQIFNRIKHTRSLKERYLSLQNQLQKKRITWEKKRLLEVALLDRQVSLVGKGAASKSMLVPHKQRVLDNDLAVDDINIQIELYQLRIKELESDLEIFKTAYIEKTQKLLVSIEQSYALMRAAISKWKKRYLIVSPVNGRVILTDVWSSNQSVKKGQVVFTISGEQSDILGKSIIAQEGAGRIQVGQKVDIELDSYPAAEFGKIEGRVKQISNVPGELGYLVDIVLPSSLETTYGKKIEYRANLTGRAKIITSERRLLERFFDKILSLINN